MASMENDLISRAALLEKLDALSELFRKRGETEDKGFLAVQCGVTFAQSEVEDAPSIDAEPVVHARWIQHNAGPLKSECSACCTTFNTHMEYDGLTTKHCPCCAAIMDADAPERAESRHCGTCYWGSDELLRDAPSIAAAPVVHAYWKHKDNSRSCRRIGDYEEWYECSGCEGSAECMSDYCPKCGAKMDAPERAGKEREK